MPGPRLVLQLLAQVILHLLVRRKASLEADGPALPVTTRRAGNTL